jgi:hypothetical protein
LALVFIFITDRKNEKTYPDVHRLSTALKLFATLPHTLAWEISENAFM